MIRPTQEQYLQARQRPSDQFQVMHQTWRSLLFLHWEVPAQAVQKSLPKGLTVDTFDGKAYIGLVPFFMRNIRPRYLPAVPGISNFLETNVRTYVYDKNGTPGVWFYSLEANQWLAVKLARALFRLPYFYATMAANQEYFHKTIDYTTARKNSKQDSRFLYQGIGPTHVTEPGTFEFFLVERYVLFADIGNGRLASGQVYHPPYQIQEAQVDLWDDQLIKLAGFETNGRAPDHMLCSPGVTVDVFPIKEVT